MQEIDGYTHWSSERSGTDKGGGGLTIFYKDNLSVHRHEPQVPKELQYVMKERQWLLLHNGPKKCAFLHCYLACQTTRNDSFLKWNEDLFFLMKEEARVLKQQGFMILALGDFNTRVGRLPGLEFNTPDRNDNAPMFFNFLEETSLLIINTMPITRGQFTRFQTEPYHSASLLDYGLIDSTNHNTVTSFVIDADARFKAGSDHALLNCHINFDRGPTIAWEFKDAVQYNINSKTDFSAYQEALDDNISKIRLSEFSKLTADEMLLHISENINISAENTIGIKIKAKRKSKKRQLPPGIIKAIKEKNQLAEHINYGFYDHDVILLNNKRKELAESKQKIRQSISAILLRKRAKLRSKLLLADPSKRRFWRFLKNHMKSAGIITAAKDSKGNMVFNQNEIEDVVLEHFKNIFDGSPVPVYTSENEDASTLRDDHITQCIQEIDDILEDTPQNLPLDNFDHLTCK